MNTLARENGLTRRPATGGSASVRRPFAAPFPLSRRKAATRVASTIKDEPNNQQATSLPPQQGRLSRLLAWRAASVTAGQGKRAPGSSRISDTDVTISQISSSSSSSRRSAAEPVASGQLAADNAALPGVQARRSLQPEPAQPAAALQEGTQPSTAEPPSAVAAARSGAFSLYSWLTWGSGNPAAAPTGAEDGSSSAGTSVAATAELADGMAAAEPASVAAPTGAPGGSGAAGASWRRSWYSLRSSSSYDEADAGVAGAAAAAGSSSAPRWQQRVALDHPALQLLRQRVLSGSAPGGRRDPFKLGLVVEGGGMRGCVSGGALQALSDVGLAHAFDAVYGSSAGAINSSFFLSGQRTGVDIYHKHIASPEFINLKRLWRSRSGTASADDDPTPVLNLNFLIDHVMHSVHPLDWDAVIASPVPLKVVASSLDTLNPILLHSFTDKDDLANCLKASATVPEIAGGPRLHRGHRLVDAAVFEPVPFRSAIADGCTHVLVLCTRPLLLKRRSRVNAALADAMEVAIKKAVMSPEYMVPAWKAEVDYLAKDGISQDDMLLKAATLDDAHTLPWFAGAHVLPLYPGPDANFSPLCIDPPTLRAGVAEGRRAVLSVCQALLGDALDFSRFPEVESSNIVPARSGGVSSARLWSRYLQDDFSHHA